MRSANVRLHVLVFKYPPPPKHTRLFETSFSWTSVVFGPNSPLVFLYLLTLAKSRQRPYITLTERALYRKCEQHTQQNARNQNPIYQSPFKPDIKQSSLCISRHFALCFGQALSLELSGMATVAALMLLSVLLIGAVYANPENSQARKSFKGYVYAVTKTHFTPENMIAFFFVLS